MSIFKTLGTKIKRVVSIKNIINAGSGQFTAIAKDAQRVLTSVDPKKKTSETVFKDFDIPSPVNDYLTVVGAKQNERLTSSLANSKIVQDNVSKVNGFFSSVWLKANWIKYKTWIIVFVVAVLGFIGWKMYSKKSISRGRARR
ncbi:hypothetical protein [Flavobacterium soyangense]|uniref:Uncharacterized protein n=1 Tax=Flavobacterium soyangense TaxID=2023265 RepID=A0A930UBS9_9FLAO|nr:hypothetical protein [Flavobacterium soyangense]MBF2709252.1 hypothetical protein [Flavobacterium soyangense]